MNSDYAYTKRKLLRPNRKLHNIKALYAKGLTPQQIADQVQCNINHVRKVLNIAIPVSQPIDLVLDP